MEIIRKRAYARAGLLGNPSDGYNGKTISLIVKNFYAEVVLYEWESVDIVMSSKDRARFNSIQDLAQDVRLHGYYGGIRLIKATIKRFVDYCQQRGLELHDRNFSIRYETDIPRQVGLAGSSAIIVATLRCLMQYYNIQIPAAAQPTLVLAVETEELGISGGLQDRVIQCYEGLVFMDFDKNCATRIDDMLCYDYQVLDPDLLPPIYISYHHALSEPTERFHNDIRNRFDCGEPSVVGAMAQFADLTVQGLAALQSGDAATLSQLIDENFDTRLSIFKLAPWQVNMVHTARKCGASAKFAGSGGAIIGTYQDEDMFADLSAAMDAIGSRTFKPRL